MALWSEQFVVVNQYSRPAMKLLGVRGIVIHWTATNGATDENEQKFFDGSDGGGSRYASAHIFVDSDSAIQVIPFNEVAYHANDKACKIPKLQATASYYNGGGANLTSIGIEMCVEKDGTIHPNTIARTVEVACELCRRYGLNPLVDIYRHYDVTGKNCPAPWVSNVGLFNDFKNRVNARLAGQPAPAPAPAPSPSPAPAPVKTGQVLVLPASADTWTVYYVNRPPVKANPANIAGVLKPSKFGGLRYDILGHGTEPDTYIIQTANFGTVKIYATTAIGARFENGNAPAPVPAPQPAPSATKKYLVLPASATSWRVYPTNKAPVKGNECGLLNPAKFGGLTYEILGNPQADVYTIKTANFGIVNIYGASSTGAKIVVK